MKLIRYDYYLLDSMQDLKISVVPIHHHHTRCRGTLFWNESHVYNFLSLLHSLLCVKATHNLHKNQCIHQLSATTKSSYSTWNSSSPFSIVSCVMIATARSTSAWQVISLWQNTCSRMPQFFKRPFSVSWRFIAWAIIGRWCSGTVGQFGHLTNSALIRIEIVFVAILEYCYVRVLSGGIWSINPNQCSS